MVPRGTVRKIDAGGGSARRRRRSAAAALAQFGKYEFRDGLERVEHAVALGRDRFEVGYVRRIQQPAQLFDRRSARQVALVVLDDERDLIERVALLREVRAQILERLDVRFH